MEGVVWGMGMGMGRGTNPLFAVDLLEDSLVGNLVKVSTLDLGANTHKLPAESILAGSVNHLGLDLGVVRGPNGFKQNVKGALAKRASTPVMTWQFGLFLNPLCRQSVRGCNGIFPPEDLSLFFFPPCDHVPSCLSWIQAMDQALPNFPFLFHGVCLTR